MAKLKALKRLSILLALAVVLTLFAFPLTASAQNTWHVSKWTKYQGNPVLNPGSAGEWDDGGVYSPTVVYHGGTYHMWYSASGGGTGGEIGYATSPDGVTWSKYDDPATTIHPYAESDPVLNPGSSGEWDDGYIAHPDVLYDGATYHMWYNGCDVTGTRAIGYATSPDGINWTKHPGNPVLNPGSPGEWDDSHVYHPDVLYHGTTYHMWYDGVDAALTWRIGYATSLDGITWSKYDNPATTAHPYAQSDPVLNPGSSGEWDDVYIDSPDVLYDGTTYHMWYSGFDGMTRGVGYATSPDGITWSKYDDPITTAAPYAESDPVLNPGPAGEWDYAGVYSPGILHDGTTYHMWYDGVDAALTWRIGYATNSYIDADFLSIKNAIEYADPEDTILVHPGKYDEGLLIIKSLTLQSASGNWHDTIIDDPILSPEIVIFGEVNVTVQGFGITGGSYGVSVSGVGSTVNILDCRIHHNAADGIRVAGGGTLLNIERNIISDNGNPGGGCGVYIEQAWSTVNIRNNIVGGEPLPSGYTLYEGNDGDGIRVDNVPSTAHMVIEENHINANDGDGIDLAPDSSVEGSVNIKNNVIALAFIMHCGGIDERRGNQDNGIHVGEVKGTGRISIEGNAISENDHDGICFDEGVSAILGRVSIRHNLIGGWTYYPEDPGAPVRYYGNDGEGISISEVGDSGGVNIEGNKISENARVIPDTGITINKIYGKVNLGGNDIGAWEDEHGESYLGNEGQGILVISVFSGAELTIGPDNSIKENTGHGIDIFWGQADSSIEIHHNFLNDNDPLECGCGIKLGSGGVYGALVSDNIVTKHHEGIHLDENSEKNIVQYNEISGNDHGVWVEGNDNEIWANDIVNNEMLDSGIHLTSTASGTIAHCNYIMGNGLCGVCNENPTEEADATYNWWGCSGGPGAAGCDPVCGKVAYAPWLTAPGPDGDDDGLTCREELGHGTDPNNPDTDGDGFSDGTEVAHVTDPLNPASHPPIPGPGVAVGGEAHPINRIAVLAPWIALATAIIAGATITWRRRRTQG